MKNLHIILIVLITIAVAGCEETFDTPLKSMLGVTLKYSLDTDTETPTVTAQGVDNDSILISAMAATNFYLQLSPGESTSYVITFDTVSDADTITILHETTLKHESMGSGFFYEYVLKEPVEHTVTRINSVIIEDSNVTQTRNEQHITIYLNSPPVIPAE